MASTKAQIAASKRYNQRTGYVKNNIKQVMILIHKEHDKDIIEWLDQQDNKSGYIKDLIRRDMEAYQEAMKHENL